MRNKKKHIERKVFLMFLFAIVLCNPITINAQETHKKKKYQSDSIQYCDTANIFLVATEQDAMFMGGTIEEFHTYILKNKVYPPKALKNKIEGIVIVQFVVMCDGRVSKIKVIRSSGSDELDNEAIRAIRASPKWTPARFHGHAINLLYTMPVQFWL